ncbi:tyrosine-protein phosphatase YwqE [Salinicoccus halitifaciens]|uniref:Tyrosine-protein phosphatase YwqE n=1 Tax=Salinicoccus halitifaciens TaxID=1073415 RepID=A0ABV2ECE1_9STAP
MIDIHNHLLINTDDGPTSKTEARDLLKQAEGQGITDVMIPRTTMQASITPRRAKYFLKSKHFTKSLKRKTSTSTSITDRRSASMNISWKNCATGSARL